jgi:hypothetical protein
MQNPHAHFVIHRGGDLFDVVTGYKLNTEPLSLADANRLARRSSCSIVSVAGNLVPPYTLPSDDYDRRRRREMV